MNNNEINFEYFSLLSPPEGYKLGKAIGTTYSLDLKTALSVPLAFHFRYGIDAELINDPFALFLSLKETASKIDLFCQLGGISSKVNDNKLYRFIENSLNEINLENGKSFHPKIWIIRFEKEGAPSIYKVINLSRNLTSDSSWDMVIAFEGELRETGTAIDSKTNQPLVDFIQFLYTTSGKIAPADLINDLGKVSFRPLNDNFYNSIEFLPIGIGRTSKALDFIYKDLEQAPYEHIVTVSPFVSQGILDKLLENTRKLTLISRLKTLEELDQKKLAAVECFYINEKIVNGGANSLSEDVESSTVNENDKPTEDVKLPVFDLHAKTYLLKDRGSYELFLGSANASYNAFNGNVEFLIRVTGERRDAARVFMETYFTPSNDFLAKFTPDLTRQKKAEDTREKLLDKYHFEMCIQLSNAKSVCKKQDENSYAIQIEFNSLSPNVDGIEAFIRPLSVNQSYQKPISNKIEFSNIHLKDLSKLFVINVTDNISGLNKSSILKLNIENLPANREEAVVRSLINNKSDLFRLLRLLLSDDIVDALLDGPPDGTPGKGSSKWNYPTDDEYAIFEKMMVASSRNPEKLKEVKTVIDYLENNNSSQGIEDMDIKDFIAFWNNFKSVIKN